MVLGLAKLSWVFGTIKVKGSPLASASKYVMCCDNSFGYHNTIISIVKIAAIHTKNYMDTHSKLTKYISSVC